jgi:hypothetical protein
VTVVREFRSYDSILCDLAHAKMNVENQLLLMTAVTRQRLAMTRVDNYSGQEALSLDR